MIDFGREAVHLQDEHGGITAFADHADRRLFHYLSSRPRVRRRADGSPDITLLRYNITGPVRDAIGGGLLAISVDLGVEPERIDALRTRIVRGFELDGPPRLSPLIAERGSAKLLLIDRVSGEPAPETESPALVERILGTSSPALYGDQVTTFLAVLSPDAATLVEQALAAQTLPAGVVYALEVVGIRPALRGRFTARWSDVYDQLENRFHGGKLLLAADIGTVMEELTRSELIRIEIDQLVPEAEKIAAYQQIFEQAQLETVGKFFQPTLGQQPLSEGGDDAIRRGIADVIGLFSFTYTFIETDRNELKTTRYDLGVARAERHVLAPQGTLAELLGPDFDVAAHRRDLEPQAAREMRFDIGSAVDLAASAVRSIELELGYGERRETAVLTAEVPETRFTAFYQEAHGRALSLRYTAHLLLDAAGDGLAQVSAPERPYLERSIRINPLELVRDVSVQAVARGVPWERFPQVLVDLRATPSDGREPLEATLELSATHAEAGWSVRLAQHDSAALEGRLRYVASDGRVLTQDWEPIEPGVWVVADPLPDALRVQIVAAARFGDEVDRLVVELQRVESPDEVASFELTSEAPSASWAVALPDVADVAAREAQRAWRYRVLVRTVRGEVRQGEWRDGSGARLVVGGVFGLRDVQLLLFGPALAELDVLALKVRFAFADPEANLHAEHEQLVTALGEPIAWRYPFADPSRVRWSWQLTRVLRDGTLVHEPPEPKLTDELMSVHVLKPLP